MDVPDGGMVPPEGLFKEVKYYVTGTLEDRVQAALEAGGAKKTAYLSGSNTHCIVGGVDPDYSEVRHSSSFSEHIFTDCR
jgi:hypothetical protein